MLDSSSKVVLTTCWWQDQKTIANYIPSLDGIVLNSIKYKECLWLKWISFICAPFWNIIWFKNINLSISATPWSCQPTHTKTKRKSCMSIFTRFFFFFNVLFFVLSKKIYQLYLLNSKDYSGSIRVLWKHFIRY